MENTAHTDTVEVVSLVEARRLAAMWFTSNDATVGFGLYGNVTDAGIEAWKERRRRAAEINSTFTAAAVAEMDQVIAYMEQHRRLDREAFELTASAS